MALTKCFVILFLVYLNFDISPLHSAAIPEKLDLPESITENDENSELYTTTGATEEDIGKIFEAYEKLYINDDEVTKNANNEKWSETQPEEETTSLDLETTEPTADDVVESIHSIMDEKIDAKKNRTDRTIVVVVTTTNVFNVNGSDASSKRQHTLLSFGTPGMIHKETSTDATLALHNKITTAFFNSNPSPIAEQPETLKTSDNKESIAEGGKEVVLEDSVGDVENIPHVTEDGSATEQSRSKVEDDNEQESEIDIRRLDESADIQNAILKTKSEGRSFDDELPSEDSNDILKIVEIVPSRNEPSTGSLSKPFEIPVQVPQDSSLMEAIENILDTDVRKAFERDIPHTQHVPLDINIEEEALYAPLKDLSEYIIEEAIKADKDEHSEDIIRKWVENVVEVEKSTEEKNYNRESDSTTDSDNLTDAPVTDIEQKTTTTITTEEPTIVSITEEATPTTKIIDDKETTATDVALSKETTTTTLSEDDGTTGGPASNSAKGQIGVVNENEESFTPTTSAHYAFEAPVTDNKTEESNEDQDPERLETLQKRNSLDESVLAERDELSNSSNNEGTESIAENESDVQDNMSDTQHITIPDVESTATHTDPQDTFLSESTSSIESESQLQPITSEDGTNSVINTFETLVDQSFDEYPIYVPLDTTTEFITNPNLYIGAEFSGAQLAAILEEAERARTASNVKILSSIRPNVEFSTEENSVDTPTLFIDAVTSQNEVSTSFDLEAKQEAEESTPNEAEEDTPNGAEDTPDQAEDTPDEAKDKPDEAEENPEYTFQPRFLVDGPSDEVDQAKTLINIYEKHIEDRASTTTKPHGEDVVSEVVKVDEETTEQHQIIKKPGVRGTTHNGTIVELKAINDTNVESNHLVASETANVESRSFGENDDNPVDPLRTLVEAVELTADITKAVDNFQSVIGPNDSIHLAANQIIEIENDMELVESAEELKVAKASPTWSGAATYIYIAGGVLSTGLIVLLGVVSYLRFRQFKRNLLFSC